MLYKIICLICKNEIPDNRFGNHLKTHAIRQEDYFHKYMPCKDLYTGDLIEFKSKEQYFSSHFNSRGTMISFFKNAPEDVAQETAIDQLKKRKEYKGLVYAPSYTEGRSSLIPTPQCFQMLKLDYAKVCLDLGLKLKYHYELLPEFQAVPDDLICLIDSREQLALDMGIKTVKTALDFGDLCLKSNRIEFAKIFFERKGFSDLLLTISQGYERFCNELDRCRDFGGYLFIMVEKDLQTVLNFNESKWYGKFTKCSPEFIFSRIREICQKYENVQWVFCKNRQHMTDLIIKIFTCKNAKILDWQYLITEKLV